MARIKGFPRKFNIPKDAAYFGRPSAADSPWTGGGYLRGIIYEVRLSPFAFIPRAWTDDPNISLAAVTATQNTIFGANIDLPDGCRLLTAEVFGAAPGETWELWRVDNTANDLTIVMSAAFNTKDTYDEANTVPVTPGADIIDNANFAYLFDTSVLENDETISGAKLQFIYD